MAGIRAGYHGDWLGTIKVGAAELRMAVHITRTIAGGFEGTLDSVDQGASGIPITSITQDASKGSFRVEAVNGTYDDKFSSDGTVIDGTWTQVQPRALNLRRGVWKTEHKPAKPALVLDES